MNPIIKKKWLKALRSGKYKQTYGTLRSCVKQEFKYCCLGVLCDIFAKEKGKDFDKVIQVIPEGLLPQEVLDWAEVKQEERFITSCDNVSLAMINDKWGVNNTRANNFTEIAKVIEEQI